MARPIRRRTQLLTNRRRRIRRRRWLIGGAAAGALIALVALLALVALRDQPGQAFADEGNLHLEAEPTSYLWNTSPPTSGPHSPQIARWGEHTETVPEWLQVHNLEDGGVIMHYNCADGCEDVVAKLRDVLADRGTEQLILHPYPDMDATIALTAWTRMLTLDEVDREQIDAFIDAYRGLDHHR